MNAENRYQRHLPWLNLVLLGVIGAVVLWTFWPLVPKPWPALNPTEAERPVTARGDLAGIEKTTIAIFREASPSVVHITTLVNATQPFSMNIEQVPEGTGSGFVWDKNGHVVTNFHVIRGADAAVIVLADGSRWQGRLVGAYPDKDLAVLSIDAPAAKLHPIMVGSLGQSAGRPDGVRDRQSLRPRPDADHRRGQRARARDRIDARAATSATSSRPTPRSIRAIPAVRCWTAPAG